MTGELGAADAAAQLPAPIKRAMLEAQLAQAIRRAQKNYQQVNNPRQTKPSPNPPHLGKKIDIRV